MLSKAGAIEALILDHEPDIIAVTETWLHRDVEDSEVTPPGYVILRKDRPSRGGGDVLLLGDFNLPGIIRLSQSCGAEQVGSAEQLLELAFCYGITQIVGDFTRIETTRSCILDLGFVSPGLLPFLSGCDVEEGLSDHRIVVTSLAMSQTLRVSTRLAQYRILEPPIMYRS